MASKRRKLTYEDLLGIIDDLREEVAQLRGELAKAKKDSSNSSKPPSSDIVKPKKGGKDKKGDKRKIGGQPGHEKHQRSFNLSDADVKHGYTLDECPYSGAGTLFPLPDKTKIVYQYELVERPVLLHAHMSFAYWCTECEEIHYSKVPSEIRRGGLVGERLTSFMGFLKGGCHASYSTIHNLLADAMGASISEGMIAKVIQKVSRSLAFPYEKLVDRLWAERFLNIDETGHKENGDLMWNWCFRAKDFTVFHIADTRGAAVLEKILGLQCEAVIGSDHYGAYRKFMKEAPVLVQFCLAHLIRELKFLAESVNKSTAAYGCRLLEILKRIFSLIHTREQMTETRFRKLMSKERDLFLKKARRTQAGGEARKLARRFKKYGEEYFTFITEPGIDPTNNVAERAIRFCVIDRRITQGTRSEKGRQWCERIWTTMATCKQQGRSAFNYLSEAVQAFFANIDPPSLLPVE